MVSAVAVAAPAGESMPLASSLATSVTAQPVQGGGATTTTTTYTVPPPAAAGASGAQFMGGLGRQSAAITCPSCQQQTMTRTTDQIDGITVIIAVVLLLLFWPLCWLPFCIPACKVRLVMWCVGPRCISVNNL